VRFEHTLFSLPLLLAGAWLGAGGVPPGRTLLWILVAGTGARTLALALNRIIDLEIDARNPRTAGRELPAGKMTLTQAWLVTAVGAVLYFVAAAMLPPLCLKLSPIPVIVFVGYPLLKRVTVLAHYGVGLALALGPLGAWVAVTGALLPFGPAHLLALFTLFWVGGFDIIYATLDEEVDRREGLKSLPAALGRTGALRVAAGTHVAAVLMLVLAVSRHLTTPVAWGLLALVAVLFAAEHWLADRVNLAFFHVNAVLGFVVFAVVWGGLS
jgi:4-hydroxybenzoate polyprenyltransferase